VLEACAAGVPVVTSTRVGASELLHEALARLVIDDPENVAALRRALEEAVGAGHESFAQAARRVAEEHPWTRHIDEVESMLREVADG